MKQFGDIIGVSHTSVKRYEEGTLPDINILLKIASAGKIDLGMLILGELLPVDVREARPLEINIIDDKKHKADGLKEYDYIPVPITEGKVAAGAPRIMEDDTIDYLLIHFWMLKKSEVSKNIIACRLEGESMYPHLSSGDIVIIDRGIDKDKIEERRIYAIFESGGITVKMLQKDGPHLYLVPSNSAEKIRHVDLREVEHPVVGLVVGAWKNFGGKLD